MKEILVFFGLILAACGANPAFAQSEMGCGPTETVRGHIHSIATQANAVVMNLNHEQTQRFIDFINKVPPESELKADTVTLIVAQDLRSMSFFTTGDETCGSVNLNPAMTQAAVNYAVGVGA